MKLSYCNTEGDVNLSEERAKWNDTLSNESKEMLDRDASVFIKQSLSTPCIDAITKCEGVYITLVSGEKLLDFHGNNVHQVGYRHPKVIEAMTKQMQTLPFCPRRFTNQPSIDLANSLIKLSPEGMNKVLFAPGGTSVNSMAIKLARLITGKHKIISMWDSFHGAGLDTISVGGESLFREGVGPLMPGVSHVPSPMIYRNIWNKGSDLQDYINYVEMVIKNEGDVGAFIAETIRDTDVQIPTKEYWQAIRLLCDKYDIMLILDEIPIAIGRTGKFFAFEHFDIIPDIVTIGKGLGGGVFPIAAMITHDKYDNYAKHSLGHFTHEKSPMGAAAANAVVEIVTKELLPIHIPPLAQRMQEHCLILKEKYDLVGDVRGLGMLWGIELVRNQQTKEKASTEAEKILYHCLKKGLSFKVSQSNVITLSPAMIITEEQLDKAFEILDDAIKSINNL